MAYRLPSPAFSHLVKNPEALAEHLRDIHQTLKKLEKITNTQAVSAKHQSPVAQKPPRCTFSVARASSGLAFVSIENPEFSESAKHSPRALYHRVWYSTDAGFRSNVTKLHPSHQTHYSIPHDPGQKLFAQVSSSYDGVSWTLPIIREAE